MVMEAKPSPTVVGREFVRQYYTLLHNSPDHLHRFYNQHSSFTHGGLDPDINKDDVLIIGQKNIHDKIQQLNFRDCHAKISYVDAQATLGDGVVVQVSGELSNDGHPMRRFTQTFVLACQSPKKYYVHNDIFRYQDMYNEDDEATPRVGEEHDTNDSNVTTASSDSSNSMIVPQNATVFYQAPANVVVNNATVIPSFPQALQAQAPAVNGVIIHDDMLKNISTQTTQHMTQPPQQILQNAQPTIIAQVPQNIPIAPAAASLPLPVEPVAVVLTESAPIMSETIQYEAEQANESENEDRSKESDVVAEDIMQSAPAPSSVPAAPKNWANLVKGGPGLVFSATAPQPDIPAAPQSFVAITQQQQQQAQQQQKVQTNDNFANGERRRNNNTGERERRTSGSNYNGSQDGNCSLFLGNLPTRATEEELRQMFSVFGKINDLRIHNKSSQNRQVPNFGFIKFEDPASALKLQESTPIYYPDLKDSNGQKLNVELKIRKEGGQAPRPITSGGPNMDRGRNSNPGSGMNRNGSGGRGERREDRGGNRQFNRTDRPAMGPRNGNANGTGTGTTFTNTRR